MNWDYIAGYFDGEGTAWSQSKGKSSAKVYLSWANTDLKSLQYMQTFMGCGYVRAIKKNERYKQAYTLSITRKDDVERVARQLLQRCIIKRDALLRLLEVANGIRSNPTYGILTRIDPEEIRHLYWDEKKTMSDIAERYGVTWTAIRQCMRRNGIPSRSRSEIQRIAKHDSEAWKHRSEKLSARRKANWQDPEYRENQVKSMAASQVKRVKSRQETRHLRGGTW